MRIVAALLAAIGLALPAAGQEEGPPDVPAGPAAIEGRVVDEDSGAGVGDVLVILYSLLPSGEPGLRQGRADAEGRFRFADVSGDPGVVYLVGTRVGGVPFGARAVFQEGEPVRSVTIEVSEPSLDTGAVSLAPAEIRLEQGCDTLRVHHLQTLTNGAGRVVYVPPDARGEAESLFELLLPEGASEVESPVGTAAEGFLREGRRLRFFGPVYPGSATIEFAYALADPGEAFAIGFPRGAEGARVLVPSGMSVDAGALRDEGERPLPNGVHRSLQSGPLGAGDALLLAVQVDAGASVPLTLAEARMWLELDDAAIDVRELYQIHVDGGPATSASGEPLLCIPLPSGAQALRFSDASMQLGLSRDPGGALALRGPLPPGDSTLSLGYRLPIAAQPAGFERRFGRDVDLVTLLVADTGIVPESQRLHRRRPIRTEDRSYLHLEAYGVEAGEAVSVALRAIPPRRPLPALASSGFVLLLAATAVLYLVAPLRRATGADTPERDSVISRERQAVYASIDDLDEDFETGKLSAEDHARMRDELRARAVALLAAERAAEASAEETKSTDCPRCPRCDVETAPDDRFCRQCGAPLA